MKYAMVKTSFQPSDLLVIDTSLILEAKLNRSFINLEFVRIPLFINSLQNSIIHPFDVNIFFISILIFNVSTSVLTRNVYIPISAISILVRSIDIIIVFVVSWIACTVFILIIWINMIIIVVMRIYFVITFS